MSGPPADPGPTEPDKDALIADLRRQLGAAQSEVRVLRRRLGPAGAAEARPADSSSERGLLEELRDAAPRKVDAPATVAVRPGRRFDLWRSPVLVGLVMVLLTGFTIDAGVGMYQARALREARQARLLLENTAMRSLYVELKGISYEPDGRSYRMTLFLQNVSPAGPLYVMLNAVAVYVQAGMVWQQVPSRPAEGVSWGVVKVVDGYAFDVVFTPDVACAHPVGPAGQRAGPAGQRRRRTPHALLCLSEAARRQRRGHQGAQQVDPHPADLHSDAAALSGIGRQSRLLLSS